MLANNATQNVWAFIIIPVHGIIFILRLIDEKSGFYSILDFYSIVGDRKLSKALVTFAALTLNPSPRAGEGLQSGSPSPRVGEGANLLH
jgi:hypothetical protein